jgi:hypothetical protein
MNPGSGIHKQRPYQSGIKFKDDGESTMRLASRQAGPQQAAPPPMRSDGGGELRRRWAGGAASKPPTLYEPKGGAPAAVVGMAGSFGAWDCGGAKRLVSGRAAMRAV